VSSDEAFAEKVASRRAVGSSQIRRATNGGGHDGAMTTVGDCPVNRYLASMSIQKPSARRRRNLDLASRSGGRTICAC